MDEPDYNVRIEGFCAGKRLLSTTRNEPEVILPILNNALFYVLSVSNSLSCLEKRLHLSSVADISLCSLPFIVG